MIKEKVNRYSSNYNSL